MNNLPALKRLDSLLAHLTSADSVIIISHASPEGNTRYNTRLTRSRAKAVKGYIIWKYPHADQYRIFIRPRGENWQGLRSMVEADETIPNRQEILALLDKETDIERRKTLLRHLNGGNTYRYISKYLFPALREATIYKITPETGNRDTCPFSMDGEQRKEIADNVPHDALGTSAREPVVTSPREQESTHFPVSPGRPRFALKTNLLTCAGVLPEGKLAAFRPNLAAEFFFARRWSACIAGEYSRWKGGKRSEFWGISGYSVEPRLWLKGDGRYRGWYTGIYAQTGDFDHQPKPDGNTTAAGDCSTGHYRSAGVSLGFYLPLGKHLGIEAGIRGGYRNASAKAYDNESPRYYHHHDFTSSRWGITGLNISVGYRWTKTMKR